MNTHHDKTGQPDEHRRDREHESGRLLYTPADAARILSIKESWLRRHAGDRTIPSTLVGKHLRFSQADLTDIVERFRRPPRPSSRRVPRRSAQGSAALIGDI